ncbi:MAG: hypothetical protein KIT84_14335 [Labilithrix sp.]|nr:hypothetical protein [Labilithrix sp.]MCW5812200.1 hypothetical protein [Labilithrix sp.]
MKKLGTANVIALGGLTAALLAVACGGGDEEAADDGESTSSSSSSSGSSGKSSTSSTSSSGGGNAPTCDPSGTYEFGSPAWIGNDGICPDFAKNLNGRPGETYTYEKNADGTFSEKDVEGGINPMTVVPNDEGQCALSGPQSLTGIGVKDQDGNDVKADLKGLTLVVFDGATAVYSGRAQLTAQSGEAKGLPCDLAFETTGTKK